MIEYEYRTVNPTIMLSSDTVCPRCRHVFSVSPSTSPTLTKPGDTQLSTTVLYATQQYSNLCHEKSAALHHLKHSDDVKLEKEIPPTLPPRLKPTTYANIPPPPQTTATTTVPTSSTKSYVTMSNLNLRPTNLSSNCNSNSNNNNNCNSPNEQPTFVPVESPKTPRTSEVVVNHPINNLFASPLSSTHSTPLSTTSLSSSTSTTSTPNGGRVYRQLSGGGLIDTSNNNFFRIHELQPMHQMCGGGLINTRPDDDSPFLLSESSKSLSLPLPKTTNDYCDPSSSSSPASISIYPSSSNISIVVPTSMHTSLEISPNTINIKLPRQQLSERLLNNHRNTSPSTGRELQPTRRIIPQPLPPPPPPPATAPVLLRDRMIFPSPASPIKQQSYNKTAPVDDMQCLTRTVHCLKESGWFHEGLSWNESENLLQGSTNGTFIVRESSNPNFLFAITVQTEQEPTSVRIQYDNGCFRLDCVSHVTPIVPQFDCVVDLIEYYVTKHNQHHSGNKRTNSGNLSKSKVDIFPGNQVFVDENGCINSVVSLRKPLRSSVPSLMHCARLSINKQLKKCDNYSKRELSQILDQLELPKSLKTYLFQYPYSL